MTHARQSYGPKLKRFFPRQVVRLAKQIAGQPDLSPQRLAFRAYIASRMAHILTNDAQSLRTTP